jgi:hypothetical protein
MLASVSILLTQKVSGCISMSDRAGAIGNHGFENGIFRLFAVAQCLVDEAIDLGNGGG